MNARLSLSFALVAACLVVGASATASFAHLQVNLVEKTNTLLQGLQEAGQPSQACMAAFQVFGGLQQQCSFALVSLGNSSVTDADITRICTSDCIPRIKAALKAIDIGCSGSGGPLDGFSSILEFITANLRTTCLKYNGQYCYVNFTRSVNALNAHQGSTYTVDELTQICTPCTSIVYKAINELVNSSISFPSIVNSICVKNNDEFCYPKFQNFTNSQSSFGDQGPPLEALCDRCIQKAVIATDELFNTHEGAQFLNRSASQCVRDGQNRLCGQVVGEPFDDVKRDCVPDQIMAGSCSNACANSVYTLITIGGCCAGNAVAQGAKSLGVEPPVLIQGLKAACRLNVSFPDPCRPKTAEVNLSFKNLKYDYYLAHKAEVDQKVIKDVASQAGVPSSEVTVTGAVAQAQSKFSSMAARMALLANGGTTITTAITSSTVDVASVQSQLQAAQASGTLSFPSLAQLPASASVDPTLSPGEAPTDGQDPSGSTSAAALAQPSAFLALLMVALALIA